VEALASVDALTADEDPQDAATSRRRQMHAQANDTERYAQELKEADESSFAEQADGDGAEDGVGSRARRMQALIELDEVQGKRALGGAAAPAQANAQVRSSCPFKAEYILQLYLVSTSHLSPYFAPLLSLCPSRLCIAPCRIPGHRSRRPVQPPPASPASI
jgi:hypothetical protein